MISQHLDYGGKPPEFLNIVDCTRIVNSVIGYPGITPWEYVLLPYDDIRDIEAWMHYQRQFAKIEANKKDKKEQ